MFHLRAKLELEALQNYSGADIKNQESKREESSLNIYVCPDSQYTVNITRMYRAFLIKDTIQKSFAIIYLLKISEHFCSDSQSMVFSSENIIRHDISHGTWITRKCAEVVYPSQSND